MSLPSQSIKVPTYYENLADADLPGGISTTHEYAGVSRPARRAVVGSINGGIVLTRIDSVEVAMSAAQLAKLGGVVERQFVAIASANCTDISVEY